MAVARFPRAARLRRSQDFRRVFGAGGRQVDACFVVIAASNDLDRPRLGLAISRRRARRAVDRNRLKRVVRESFRQHALSLPPLDVVVLARNSAVARDNAALLTSLAAHWRRLIDNAEMRSPDPHG